MDNLRLQFSYFFFQPLHFAGNLGAGFDFRCLILQPSGYCPTLLPDAKNILLGRQRALQFIDALGVALGARVRDAGRSLRLGQLSFIQGFY